MAALKPTGEAWTTRTMLKASQMRQSPSRHRVQFIGIGHVTIRTATIETAQLMQPVQPGLLLHVPTSLRSDTSHTYQHEDVLIGARGLEAVDSSKPKLQLE